MSAKDQPENDPLILNELKIPGRTGPVSETPKVWGINRAAALDNFPRQGLLCQAGPWAPMNPHDRLVIYKNKTQEILREIVNTGEVNTELQMFVEARHITEGTYTLSYSVTRLGGVAEDSLETQVLVKLTRPGGEDHSEEPGHPDLVMTIPEEILKGGIDEDNVASGVPITIGKPDDKPPYPFAAAGDVIRVSWGGVFVLSAPLTQAQADGTESIIVKIDTATIRNAGDSDDSGLAVVFEVYDLVDNRSSDWSVEQRVLVAVDKTRLVAPLLKEAQNNVLDVDKLGDADGTAQVWVSGTSFKVGDIPILKIRGTPQEGPPVDIEVPGEPLVSVPTTHETKIDNRILRQLAKSQIALSYRLEKADGSADLPAKTQFISVIGEVQRLEAPVALDAKQGALDPLLPQVRIEVPFAASLAAGQVINLFWLGTRPDLEAYLPTLPPRLITQGDYDAKEPLLIIVDKKHLTPIIGGKLELYYQLLTEDSVFNQMDRFQQTRAIRESKHADILQIGEARKELPEPTVDGVVDGVLPPDTNGTNLIVGYLKTVKGDEVIYHWEGSKTGMHSDSLKLNDFTAGQPVPFTIKAELIKGNEGGTVKASYELKRAAGGTSYSDTLEFSVGVALDLKEPEIKEAPNNILQPIAAKDTLTAIVRAYPNMIGTQVSVTWTGTPGDGSKTEGPLDVTAQQDLEVPLPNSLVAFNLGNDDVMVTYVVTRNGTPQGSKEMTLKVAPIVDGDPELGIPFITEAANDGAGPELNINVLTADATMRVNNWPLIFPDQYVWSRLKGTNKDNTTYSKTFWQPPASKTNEEWIKQGFNTHAILLSDLRNLKNDSELALEIKTAFGGSSDEKYATNFKERVYNVKTANPLVWNDSPVTLTIHTASFEGVSPDWDIMADIYSLSLLRAAKEGVRPYTYKSANESVATVDVYGYIKAMGKGETIITLQDSAGETKTLKVTVVNDHYTLLYSPQIGTQEEFVVWAEKVGGRLPPPDPLGNVLGTLYRQKNAKWHHVSYRRTSDTEMMLNPHFTFQFYPSPNIAPFLAVKK
ncbi:hypothetical protein PS925_00726 [Pseudomonas fluorescens]|uniref:BIG2 domain-containing protein n=1 Tax=Pseudomonas fluorescens TaxID=294 RepID=A0A5E7SC50_PSEFL|nr:hypothetical protein [Pseudomonas fluorescens]VVP83799.1 hypothetical protein PS925_00726 [Pseudomonas fluorescens]